MAKKRDRVTTQSYKDRVLMMYPDARIEQRGGPSGFQYVVCFHPGDTFEEQAKRGAHNNTKEAWRYAAIVDCRVA